MGACAVNDMRVVCSISGGKDSAAMALHLRERGIQFEAVFCDTGWEHADTYAYLRDALDPLIGPIRWLKSERGGMVEHVRRKMMFPSRVRRFCTEVLKVEPLQRHFSTVVAEEMNSASPRWVINCVGIRADESQSRGRMPEWERWGADHGASGLPVVVWRPLIRWSEQDVIDIHRRHGLAPNPLYLRGASRVGCWPCIHARKGEIALVAREDPARIALIRELEAELTARAQVRSTARAGLPFPDNLDEEEANVERELRDPDHWRQTRTYFGIGEKSRGEVSWIDSVVSWSKTDRGGRQFQLFDDPSEGARDGCMRWGLCEAEGTKP